MHVIKFLDGLRAYGVHIHLVSCREEGKPPLHLIRAVPVRAEEMRSFMDKGS